MRFDYLLPYLCSGNLSVDHSDWRFCVIFGCYSGFCNILVIYTAEYNFVNNRQI